MQLHSTSAQPTRRGITFAVDTVTPATEPLPQVKTYKAVEEMLDSPIESCCDYGGEVIDRVRYHPLLAAVFLAYSQHRPLMLTPDAVWLTIAQGVAHHMVLHADRLRDRFVRHQGKLTLEVGLKGWAKGSPENPWPEAFAGWASQIRDHVGGETYDLLVNDFSTTTVVERAASHVVLMDIFERYFHYRAVCICGIPSITLEGAPADWDRLREKVRRLGRLFELNWWTAHLMLICDQFCRAARGDVDVAHWRRICKLEEAYGGDIINGWIAQLFPYVREWFGGPVRQRNPVFDKPEEGITSYDAPLGLSRVPFTWLDLETRVRRDMEAIGGLVGVTQDPETLALRPKVGWAVREAQGIDLLLLRLQRDGHRTRPGATDLIARDPRGWLEGASLPQDLSQFYHHTEGAELFVSPDGAPARFVIVPSSEAKYIASPPTDWNEPEWHRLCRLVDGTELVINVCNNETDSSDRCIHRVCHLTRGRFGTMPHYAPVADSFEELLRKILDSGGRYWWLDG